MSKKEVEYQAKLIKKLYILFPDCFILKNDPRENQGIPDLLILVGPNWAMLEVKLEQTSDVQPNQEYYINLFSGMSFASFINPYNEEQVLHALQQAFGISW